ncbi:hypothetical protein AABB24_026549, partial [Solanum stoloniferum]
AMPDPTPTLLLSVNKQHTIQQQTAATHTNSRNQRPSKRKIHRPCFLPACSSSPASTRPHCPYRSFFSFTQLFLSENRGISAAATAAITKRSSSSCSPYRSPHPDFTGFPLKSCANGRNFKFGC